MDMLKSRKGIKFILGKGKGELNVNGDLEAFRILYCKTIFKVVLNFFC